MGDLVPFVQFKKREKHPWRILKVTLLHGCFSRFLDYTDGTKSCNVSRLIKTVSQPEVWRRFQPGVWSTFIRQLQFSFPLLQFETFFGAPITFERCYFRCRYDQIRDMLYYFLWVRYCIIRWE